MSDEELSSEELAELEAALRAGLAELQRELTGATENAKPVDLDLSIGRLSRVDALQQQNMALARRRRMETQLQQMRAALKRIGADTYGECLGCGEPIGIARLRARPEAPFCRQCQSPDARG
ncbi:MAG: TraR/DksA C4-type zinc finger protein [Myxococcota bacterium]|nr:TraR/DksA C4-type zinc finger protein [Myxococcota bacterium]